MATTGFQAGVEANDTNIRYGVETAWGSAPVVAFTSIRHTSETLAGSKSRSRPSEINQTREDSQAVTTQESAAGAINYALSYGTFDDWFASMLCNTWQAAQAIAGVAGDITITSGTNVLSSTTAGKFTNISQGQWIRLLGFTNAGNNGFWKVVTKTDATHLVLAGTGTIVTETPAGTAAQVRASTILNGTTFTSLFVEKELSSVLFLQYPGSYVSGGSLSGSLGQFMSGAFNIVAQQEQSATTTSSTGAVNAAPTGVVHNTVGGFGGVLLNQAALTAKVDSFTLNFTNTGAAGEYGMGSSVAAGVLKGSFGVNGTLKMFFKDFTYYARFKSEATGELAFITQDAAGNAYVFSLPVATLMNPSVDAGGPGQAVYASFTIEGNPQSGGGTLRIDRLPAT